MSNAAINQRLLELSRQNMMMQGGWYNRGYGGAMAGALAGAKKPWASLSQGQQASRSAKFEQFKKNSKRLGPYALFLSTKPRKLKGPLLRAEWEKQRPFYKRNYEFKYLKNPKQFYSDMGFPNPKTYYPKREPTAFAVFVQQNFPGIYAQVKRDNHPPPGMTQVQWNKNCFASAMRQTSLLYHEQHGRKSIQAVQAYRQGRPAFRIPKKREVFPPAIPNEGNKRGRLMEGEEEGLGYGDGYGYMGCNYY